jgi:cytosine/adenosine deaminase-related metal-dependent hydrolase
MTARWIFPVGDPPLERGTITIASARVVAVQPHGKRQPDLDLGECAILPGLVNAHTHLDLSGLRQITPVAGDFPAWLRAVIAHRRMRTPEQIDADVRAGLARSLACGVTLLGDISAGGASWPILATAPLRAVVFHELLGLPAPRAAGVWATALDWLRTHPPTETCRPGLSPHAPYSVRASLFRAATSLAEARHLPLAIHLAETREEMELLTRHQGPFVDFLKGVGVWDPDGLAPNVRAIVERCAGARPLFIHGNYLDPEKPLSPGATVIYCPRTHAFFGHSEHPFRRLLACGVRVALGTDSLASSPDLDVLAEARFLHRLYPDVPGATLLRMITLSGAEALGWDKETGSLEPGKSADLVVLPLPEGVSDFGDPHNLVFRAQTQVSKVMWRGEWSDVFT